ncbi:MAG TPA: ERAP1-like C-terminal domain-containing protein, partial [Kofleriaceae bacterium]|nr:ERAP1-like C-terminal domain-containing protein [Kofleriaceae bacterium]
EKLYPDMDADLEPINTRETALANDSLASARRIRQPITAEADMGAAFDRITYSKGATVIRMFERWIGPDRFQKAARAYLHAHADGNATAADFLAALDHEMGDKPVGAAFATFLDQPGVPVIAMELSCPSGGPASLELAQSRHVPAGAAPVSGEQRWQVPICVAVPDGGKRETHCTLLTEATGELALGKTCPAWVAPNVDGAGYYLSSLAPEQLKALLERGWARLPRGERLALLTDLDILVDGGKADLGAVLALLPRLGTSGDPYLLEEAVTRLDRLARFVAPDQQDSFARLVRDTVGRAGKRIGWSPRPHEKLAEARLRGRLMPLLAVEGQDRAARARAVALAHQWTADHHKVPESLWGPVLTAAVRADAKAVVPDLLARVAEEPDRVAQRAIYQAVAMGQDAELQGKALGLLLTADPVPPEMVQLLTFPPDIERQASLFDFVREHADDLLRRLPEDYQRTLVVNVCDPGRREQVASFLKSKLEPLPKIGTLSVTQKVESMDQCIARRATQAPALAAFLSGRK